MKVTLTDILRRLNKVKGPDGSGQYKALCPCHDDHNPSLSLTEKDGKVLIRCFACGAQLPDVLEALGFQRETVTPERAFKPQQGGAQILEATYLYAGGSLRKLKYRKADGSKVCTWQRKDGENWVNGRKGVSPGLYQSHDPLPEIVFLVEGEKDVDNLRWAEMPAVSLPDGAKSKWDTAYNSTFEGRAVAIIPDNDTPGREYAQMCAVNLHGVAAAVWILDLRKIWPEIPEKGDVTDLLTRFDLDPAIKKILDLMENTEKWEPSSDAPDLNGFEIISAQDLQNANLPPVKFLIEGILPEGTSLITAASKIGKSWMVLDMGLCIAAGRPFMGHATHQCGVLYLALEDSLNRLQDRMNKILNGEPAPKDFHFTTKAPKLDNGLLDMLDAHFKKFSNTGLVIIDTLQKIRGQALPRESAYAQDYREMETLKEFFDKRGISSEFVHHNRKMGDDSDPFNMISGTNGIMGAADTIWTITKKRADQEATLHITGRDAPQSSTIIRFDKDSWRWKTVGSADWINEQRAKLAYESNPIVKTIRELLKQSKDGQWKGTAKDLLTEGQKICKRPISISPQKLGYELRDLDGLLLECDGIVHQKARNGNAGNFHCFFFQNWTDEADRQEELPL